MKKLRIIFVMIILVYFSNLCVYASDNIFNFEESIDYDSKLLNEKLLEIVLKYPDILKCEIIGESLDQKPIYAVKMTDNIEEYLSNEDFYYSNKKHLLVEAGTHSKEIINPAIVVQMIEDYAKDYYNNASISSVNIKNVLKESVLHFIPLSNPDGFDLVKFGTSKINDKEVLKNLLKIGDNNFSNYKSNLNGVDINRNFNVTFFDVKSKEWNNIWNKEKSGFYSVIPSAAYYSGEENSNEPETKILEKYILENDFRAVISYHSMGRLIYWEKSMLSEEYNDRLYLLGSEVSKLVGYSLAPPKDASIKSSSGSFGDFVALSTLKPVITIETTNSNTPTAKSSYIKSEYNSVYLAPIKVLNIVNKFTESGYFDYKLYVEDKYVRDFENKGYADAFAKKMNGEILKYTGKPYTFLKFKDKYMTRKEATIYFAHKYIEEFNIDMETKLTNNFIDEKDDSINLLRALAIINATDNKFYPNRYITQAEILALLYNTTDKVSLEKEYSESDLPNIPAWSKNMYEYMLTNKIVKIEDINPNKISKTIEIIDLFNNIKSEAVD